MFRVTQLHHTAIAANNMSLLLDFYTKVIGLNRHPEKDNWLQLGNDYVLHLMPADTVLGTGRIEQHFAVEVDSLRQVAIHLLKHGLRPYLATLSYEKHWIVHPDDPLDFGIGTIFVADPEGNTVEFVQPDHGIFAAVPLHSISQ